MLIIFLNLDLLLAVHILRIIFHQVSMTKYVANHFPAVPVTAQGLPNGEAAALQHAAAFPGMQPFPGVGECGYTRLEHASVTRFMLDSTYLLINQSTWTILIKNRV